MAAFAEECMCYTVLQELPCVLNMVAILHLLTIPLQRQDKTMVAIILSALFAEQIQGDFQVLNS